MKFHAIMMTLTLERLCFYPKLSKVVEIQEGQKIPGTILKVPAINLVRQKFWRGAKKFCWSNSKIFVNDVSIGTLN